MDDTKQALRSMVNVKVIGPDELPVGLLKLALSNSSHEIVLAFYGIIVAVCMTGEYCSVEERRHHERFTQQEN